MKCEFDVMQDGEKFIYTCKLCKRSISLKRHVEKLDRNCTYKKPTVVEKAVKYVDARSKWKQAGKPFRSLERIHEIYDNECKPCEHFSEDSCGVCGCRLKRHEVSSFNKIAMATEECPIGKWKPELPVQQSEKIQGLGTSKGCGCNKKAANE